MAIRHFNVKDTKAVTYPSVWFQTHPLSTPLLSLPLVTDDNIGQLEATIVRDFGQNPLPVSVAIGFLYYHFNAVPEVLSSQWTSYGRTIGLDGAAVNLSNFFMLPQT